jgi:hypothetical protein
MPRVEASQFPGIELGMRAGCHQDTLMQQRVSPDPAEGVYETPSPKSRCLKSFKVSTSNTAGLVERSGTLAIFCFYFFYFFPGGAPDTYGRVRTLVGRDTFSVFLAGRP